MAFGTLSNFMSVLGFGGKSTGASGSKKTSTTGKAPKGTGEAGKPTPGDTGAGGTPSESGGVGTRPGPDQGPTGRQSPTTRFPFGSSILGEGRSLFPDTSVIGTGTPRAQPSSGAVRSRRRKTGFGIA